MSCYVEMTMEINLADLITLVIPLDLLAAHQWSRLNYTLGAPLFRFEAEWRRSTPPDLERLAAEFRKSSDLDLQSRLVDPRTLLLRQSLRFRWAPALRGTAVIADGRNAVQITVNLSWLYTVILATQLVRVLSPGDAFPRSAYASVFLVLAAATVLAAVLERSKFERFCDFIQDAGRGE